MEQYKWIKIVRKKYWRTKTTNAWYSRTFKRIYLYDRFFTKSKERQAKILEHEYSHHIYRNMPKVYRSIWKVLSNWKAIKYLNIFWITEYKENAYITNYAKSKIAEDWAETHEESHTCYDKRYNNYVDFKIKTVKAMMNYFINK